MLLDGADVKKGKYGDAATGDMRLHGCDVSLALATDATVGTPATSPCGNHSTFLNPSADDW